jgi:hypothetical protein
LDLVAGGRLDDEPERRGNPVVTLLLVVALIGVASKATAGTLELPKLPKLPTKPHAHRPAPVGPPGPGAKPTAAARHEIPAHVLAIYRARDTQAQCPGLSWTVLAGIGRVESNHGKSHARGVHSGHNYAGAAGPMQFLDGTWARYGRGSVYVPENAIPAAARYLCASGAPKDVPGALHHYNRSWSYVRAVLAHARRYGGR